MINIIVLFPKPSDAKNIRNILVRSGIDVTAVCTAGSQVISRFNDLEDGLIICGYKYSDRMMYDELREYMPKEFEMLLIASRAYLEEVPYLDHLTCMSMPIKVYELAEQVHNILSQISEQKKKRKRKLRERSPEEKALIQSAKSLLIQNNCLTEADAHSYLQKRSMDSGMTLVETAQRIIESYT
ncbi:MAG: ANTAR domain-containing protein [Lachnospiraceae bacterium]|nr:ANTAR domain-containing protein [Lachnospiraceae bacterium]